MEPTTAPGRDLEQLATLLRLVSSGRADSRVSLAATTGLSPSTITQRVARLVDAGLLVDDGYSESHGGRRPSVLRLNRRAGLLLTACVGATTARFAVLDLDCGVLADDEVDCDVDQGPQHVFGAVAAGWRHLLSTLTTSERVVAISVGVASAVDTSSGRMVRPLMKADWNDYELTGAFAETFPGVPVLIGNDADLMALGEHWARRSEPRGLIFIKVGTGVGCGIVDRGRLVTGTTGVAGDIGHLRVPGHPDARCYCGKSGCLTAVASGRAIAEQLSALGLPARNGRDVVQLVRSGDLEARHAVRSAALEIGAVVAMLISFYNPDHVVIGGLFGHLSEEMLTDIRSAVYENAQPVATATLSIESSLLGDRAGVVGAGVLATRHLLSPAGIAALVSRPPVAATSAR